MKTLVDSDFSTLIKKKYIRSKTSLQKHLQPASIDIPLGRTAYHLQQKFIPFSSDIKTVAKQLSIEKLDLKKGANLYRGQTYLVKCLDLDLPKNISGVVSPKSSIGRIDVRVRSIVDNHYLYDTVDAGKKGELWLEITPRSFNIRVQQGIPLAQLRLIDETLEAEKDPIQQEFITTTKGNSRKGRFYQGKLVLGLNVKPGTLIGYEAKSTNEIIDLSKKNAYEPKRFFRELYTEKKQGMLQGKFVLEKDRFYILGTKELVSIPKEYSLEMVSIDPKLGDLTVHYAGFFDPGFGFPKGANGVLEIRPHEVTTVYHGQPICLMKCFENKKIPTSMYGENCNNYQFQRGPRLSKFFKQ
ncbi:MAG: 2'-deoxycytidine 5'-triphosphate deaminase domain-containing protein [Nanobdellota archaeon]